MAKASSKTETPTPKIDPTVIYRDTAYRTRTIVLADGRAFEVLDSRIEASDPGLIAHLEKHGDFEREYTTEQ